MASSLNDWPILKSIESNFLSMVNMIAVCNGGRCDQCALLVSDGEVFAVGRSDKGCLGLANTTRTDVPCKIKELSGVAGVCVCGDYGDALAYTSEGKVYIWGDNVNSSSSKIPTLFSELTDVVDARCDSGHYLALSKSGKVYEWRGKETRNLNTLATVPTMVTINEVIVGIACSTIHSLALTDKGDVYCWGMKYNPSSSNKYDKLPMTNISIHGETIIKVAYGWRYSLVLTTSGKMFTWGYNEFGMGNHDYPDYSATPVQVGGKIGRFTDVATNCWFTSAAVTDTGAVYVWGEGVYGKSMNTPTSTQHTELHQVFANIPNSNVLWKCNNNDSINAAGSASNGVELEVSKAKNDKVSTWSVNLPDKLKEVTETMQRLEISYLKQQEKLEKLEHEHVKQLEASKNDNIKLQENLETLEQEHVKQFEASKYDNIKLQEKLETLEQEHVKQFELLHQDYLKHFEASRNVNIKLQEKLKQFEAENSILQDKLASVEKNHNEQEEKFERLNKTYQNVDRIELGIAKLGELAKLQTVTLQIEECERKSEERPVLMHRTLKLENDYSKLQVDFHGLEKEYIKQEVKLESLEKVYMKQEEHIKRLEEERMKQEWKLNGLEKDNIKQQEKVDVLEKAYIKQKERIKRLEEELMKQQDKGDVLEKACDRAAAV